MASYSLVSSNSQDMASDSLLSSNPPNMAADSLSSSNPQDMAAGSSLSSNPQNMALDSLSSANPQTMASDSFSSPNSQNMASDIISRSNELKPQESKAPNVAPRTIPPKPTIFGRSKLKEVSAEVHNLLITARDKGVSSLKSIGPSKHAPVHIPIWKGKNKHSNGLILRKIAKKLHVEDLLPPEPIPHPAETPVLTKPSMLEALPTELQFKILHFVPNLAALSCLVHASPKFHQAYIAIRKPVLQRTTWIEMVDRDVNPFSLRDFYEICVPCSKKQWNTTMQPRMKSLIANCRAFARRTDQTELEDQILYPSFTIDQCVLLLNVLDYVGWTIGGRPGHRNGKPDRMDISKRQHYHVLNFSDETMESVALIRGTATLVEFWNKSE